MILLAKLGIGAASFALVAGATLSSEGFIFLKVHEKHPDGTNLRLVVPAVLAPAALRFVPKNNLAQASSNLRPYMPALDAAIPALEDSPDGVLVEVTDPGEHVVITKHRDSIVIDVDDRDDIVHVAVPLPAVRSCLHQLASASGPI